MQVDASESIRYRIESKHRELAAELERMKERMKSEVDSVPCPVWGWSDSSRRCPSRWQGRKRSGMRRLG